MSALLESRAEIVDALDGLTGITGHAKQPHIVKAGQAWPRWTGATRGPGDSWLNTWAALVILPNDDDRAIVAAEAFTPALIDGLRSVAYVTGAEMVLFRSKDGVEYPALEITMIRE